MLVEVTVQSLGLDRASNTPVVILQEADGERVLPIWIGPGEASAIAMQLAEMKFSRPLTHDLIMSVVRRLGADLTRVIITRVSDATYFAELEIELNGETVRIDARPSDSIAVALRSSARIFAHDSLLEKAQIEIAETESKTPDFSAMKEADEDEDEGGDDDASPFTNPEELKEYLRRLNPEDFGRFTP